MVQATADVSWWIGSVSSLQTRQAAADVSCWIGLVGSLQMRQATADVSWWIGFVDSLQMRQPAADVSWWIGFVSSLQMRHTTAEVSWWIGFVSYLQMILSLLVKLPIGILMWYYHDTFLSFYYCPPPINRTSGSFACCSQIQNVCRELLKRGENSNPFARNYIPQGQSPHVSTQLAFTRSTTMQYITGSTQCCNNIFFEKMK